MSGVNPLVWDLDLTDQRSQKVLRSASSEIFPRRHKCEQTHDFRFRHSCSLQPTGSHLLWHRAVTRQAPRNASDRRRRIVDLDFPGKQRGGAPSSEKFPLFGLANSLRSCTLGDEESRVNAI